MLISTEADPLFSSMPFDWVTEFIDNFLQFVYCDCVGVIIHGRTFW